VNRTDKKNASARRVVQYCVSNATKAACTCGPRKPPCGHCTSRAVVEDEFKREAKSRFRIVAVSRERRWARCGALIARNANAAAVCGAVR